MEHIHRRLASNPRPTHIVFAEPEDERIVNAVKQLQSEGKLRVTMISKTPVPGLTVINPGSEAPMAFANQMVRDGKADGSVIGAATASGAVIVAALKAVGVKTRGGTVSSFFMLSRPDRPDPIFFADCAVVIDPTPEQLAGHTHSTRT